MFYVSMRIKTLPKPIIRHKILFDDKLWECSIQLIISNIPESNNKGFSKDVCRSMVAMLDSDRSGKLGYEEFKTLWVDIRNWKVSTEYCVI